MGNLSLNHTLASWLLSDWNLVCGMSLPFLQQWLVVGLVWPGTSYQWRHNSLVLLLLFIDFTRNFLSSLSPWLSPLGRSETSCKAHSHVMSLWCLHFWSVLTSSLLPAKQNGVQTITSASTLTVLAVCYSQWSILHCFEWLSINASSSVWITMLFAAHDNV